MSIVNIEFKHFGSKIYSNEKDLIRFSSHFIKLNKLTLLPRRVQDIMINKRKETLKGLTEFTEFSEGFKNGYDYDSCPYGNFNPINDI